MKVFRSKVEKEIVIEEKFYQIMIVFNYIKDKDVFEKFYYKMLAKRLIDRLSLSNDYEELMKLNLFIIVSIYQMAALLLFNKLLSWIVDQIQDETQIKIDLFFQVLYSLLKNERASLKDVPQNDFPITIIIQRLSSRFELKILMIKKCIDILIEKEYIERQPNEHDMLRYLI
ncbi:unnamed protein product [Rotaria sp. Silwood1]|nr:unnamed protein product [Rotaria sp. Silwood1]